MTHAGACACACACAGVRQTMRSRSPVTITAGQTLIDSSFFITFFPANMKRNTEYITTAASISSNCPNSSTACTRVFHVNLTA